MFPRQAISTKYHGPTDTRGGRISASAPAGRVYVEWDHGLSVAANHAVAAHKLASKFSWPGVYHIGGTSDGYVFVAVDTDSRAFKQPATNEVE